jgi:hypothetical protein
MTNTTTLPTSSTLDIPKRGMPVTIITGFLGSGKRQFKSEVQHL